MIIKLDYQDNNLLALKTFYKGKEKYHYIRYVVDEYSIDEAIQKIKGNKWVVALDYEGDLEHLFTLNEKPIVPVIVTKVLEDVNELSIDFMVNTIPDWVILSIKTPSDFCDMRFVEYISKKYKNIRFCGGKFLRLPDCNVGCIGRVNIPDRIPESDVKYYTEGCACILVSMHVEDVEGIEYIYAETPKLKEVQKAMGQKKVVKSLDDLFGM